MEVPFGLNSKWLNNNYKRHGKKIDVLAIHNKTKLIFAKKGKYHSKPVEKPAFFINLSKWNIKMSYDNLIFMWYAILVEIYINA